MAVKFLSEEWAQALKTELNASDSFKEAATGKTATIQQVIGGGDGEIHYWIGLADGAIDMGIGDADDPRRHDHARATRSRSRSRRASSPRSRRS